MHGPRAREPERAVAGRAASVSGVEALEERWLAALGEAGSRRSLSPREALFQRSAPASHLYRVRTGAVRLERVTADGAPMTSLVAADGDFLAEASLWTERYHCDAFAEELTEVEAVPGDLWRRRLREDPDLAMLWISRLSRQIQELRTLLELRSIRSARERVLAWVEHFPERAASGRSSQRVVASQLGLRPETLYRTLGALVEEGRLQRGGRGVTSAS